MGEASELPQPGDTINEKYRIERMLGTGGMSAVFEATHCLTGRRFALKWLKPEMAAQADIVRRFVREAKVAGRFKHPNVVEVYDFGEAGGSFFIVMELLEGESLEQRLERRGRLSPDEARRVLLPCMRGVARAHAAGVIHRDIKPANIFLCRATEERAELPKVLDFGISRFTPSQDIPRDSPVTETGVWMGTPQYMSPEQVRGRAIDHRTDIYGFGVVLYELLSGEVAFDARTVSDLMVKIATEHPRPLAELVPDIDPTLAALTMRAMTRDPAARFPDLESMIHALQSSAAFWAASASVGPAPSLPAVMHRPQGKRRVVALVAAALLGVFAVSWLLVLERSDTRTPVVEPRHFVAPGAPPVSNVHAAASGASPDHVASDAAPSAAKAAADRSARPSRTRDVARRPRTKPQKLERAVESGSTTPASGARGQSGVKFDLQDFLPRGSAARAKTRETAPAP